MPSNLEVRQLVLDAVETEIQYYDTEQALSFDDYDEIKEAVTDEVFVRLLNETRPELSEADYLAIQAKVRPRVDDCLARPQIKPRFQLRERVVCRIGGELTWAPGTIQSVEEPDPQDSRSLLPYVVKLDPPVARLISVPRDKNHTCRAEVAFGQAPEDLFFSLRCKPQRKSRGLRFAVGDRVACAVEDATGDYTTWVPGQVTDVHYDAEPDARAISLEWDWANGAGILPYRVLLDSGVRVLVHRDEHWLVRDLALQPPAPRQAEDGTRNLKRLVSRRLEGEEAAEAKWELIDHATRRVRIQATDPDEGSDTD